MNLECSPVNEELVKVLWFMKYSHSLLTRCKHIASWMLSFSVPMHARCSSCIEEVTLIGCFLSGRDQGGLTIEVCAKKIVIRGVE